MSAPGDRVVLLTGATSSIGQAIARRFLDGRDIVFASGSDPARTQALATVLAGADRLAVHAADLAHQEARLQLAGSCLARFGRVDILVHCAGVSASMPLLSPDLAKWRREMAVNLQAAAVLAGWAMADMRQRQWGRVVNIGSIYGSLGRNPVFYEGKDPPETERDDPAEAVGERDVLVVVRRAGICGSDMHILDGTNPSPVTPASSVTRWPAWWRPSAPP